MKQGILAFVCVFGLASAVSGNAGFFSGSGQMIFLTKTEQVQLVAEDVTMTPFCGGSTHYDRVDFRCKFVLKNLSAKPLKIQVGFPLDSQGLRLDKDDRSEMDLVLDYHFIARDENRTYHVRYAPGDSQRRFSHLFLWDMEFKPNEKRLLNVSYELPVSMAFIPFTTPESLEKDNPVRRTQELLFSGATKPPVSSATKQPAKPEVPPTDLGRNSSEPFWHSYIEDGVAERFQYITETGNSWAGPIEKATFRVETENVATCLGERRLLRGDPPDPMRKGVVYKDISPEGGKFDPKEGTITWEYKNYKPGKPFRFTYYLVGLPPTAAACDSWVRLLVGSNPKKADLAEMREIAAAFYGIAPHSDSAKQFVERQVWYHPKKGLRELGLTAEQKAVLARLDAISKGAK